MKCGLCQNIIQIGEAMRKVRVDEQKSYCHSACLFAADFEARIDFAEKKGVQIG